MEFQGGVRLGTGCVFDPPFMNGAGCCKVVEHVRELARTLAGAIVAGSFTKELRNANPGEIWRITPDGAGLNSLGMPNDGAPYLKANLREMVMIAHDAGKALVVNVAGFNPREFAELTYLALELGADAVEENLGCPNVIRGDGSRKPIASYDFEATEEIIAEVEFEVGEAAPVWIKVSPAEPGLIKRNAATVSRYKVVKAVVATNTSPSAYALDEKGISLITVGYAGLSGPPLKHIALGNVKQWREALPPHISVIGVGGIYRGIDVRDMTICGAEGFQMTTALLKREDREFDLMAFERITLEFDALPPLKVGSSV